MTAKRTWKLQEFVGHGSLVTCAALGHKSGRLMATGGEDGKVNMWQVGSPNCKMSLAPLSSAVEVVHFNASEELICAGSRSGALRIWDLAASKVVRQLTGHKAAVRSLDFHPYGEFIASGSDDHKVRMWDIRRKGCIFTYKGHEDRVNQVEFSPDGRWISSVSDDKTCKIWNITAGKLLHELKDHTAAVSCLQFHPNEFLLATGSYDRTSIVYDVEKIKVVSSTCLEANPIQHVLFDDSGKWLYTASQDCCKVYSWEPTCMKLDTVLVKWGKPADITISADQLKGCSFNQNIVSVHIIDITQLRKTPNIEDDSFEEQAQVRIDQRNFANITTRPHTSCGVTTLAPALPKEIHFNNNNIEDPFKHIDENTIFKPTSTLPRSPVKVEDTQEKESKTTKDDTKKVQVLPTKKTDNTTVHSAKSTPELRTKASSKASGFDPEITFYVSSPPVNSEPAKVAENSEKTSAELPPPPSDSKTDVAPVKVKHKDPPLGGALMWNESNHVPTRDKNIAEKPGVCENIPPSKPASVSKQPSPSVERRDPLNLSTTVVPSERQDPIGLDMNAFLPAKHDNVAPSVALKTDREAISTIRKGLNSMRAVLTNRHKNLEIVRALWTSGDVMTSINTAVKMKDQSLIVDLLNVLTLKPTLWNLDLCLVMLPQIKSLITSKYETYTNVGCNALKLVLKNFAQVIRSNLKTPPNVVDISREERHRKCKNCYLELNEIKTVLESKQQTSGKVGSQFRELKILISTLE